MGFSHSSFMRHLMATITPVFTAPHVNIFPNSYYDPRPSHGQHKLVNKPRQNIATYIPSRPKELSGITNPNDSFLCGPLYRKLLWQRKIGSGYNVYEKTRWDSTISKRFFRASRRHGYNGQQSSSRNLGNVHEKGRVFRNLKEKSDYLNSGFV